MYLLIYVMFIWYRTRTRAITLGRGGEVVLKVISDIQDWGKIEDELGVKVVLIVWH